MGVNRALLGDLDISASFFGGDRTSVANQRGSQQKWAWGLAFKRGLEGFSRIFGAVQKGLERPTLELVPFPNLRSLAMTQNRNCSACSFPFSPQLLLPHALPHSLLRRHNWPESRWTTGNERYLVDVRRGEVDLDFNH